MNTERIQQTINTIKEERHKYGKMLDLFGRIMIKQSELMDKIKLKPVAITKEEARSKLKKKLPLLSRKDFQIDLPNASRLFKEALEVIKSENGELTDELRKVEEALEDGGLALEDVFQSVLTSSRRISEIAEELSLDKDAILMLAIISIKPSLEVNASQIRSMMEEVSWSERYCPVCGSSPGISELRQLESSGIEGATTEGAERILHCSFCGTEWRAMRLECAFCGNSDHESMRYLYSEEEKGYRIDICEKCEKYMKTIDSRELSHEIIPVLEDIATLHLDILAEEEGYKREAWIMPYGI